MADAIRARDINKQLGKNKVVSALSLDAAPGTVVGLLGPNGAGKTTTVRILSTLLRADSGTVEIYGVDAAKQPGRVRSMIGLTGQFAAVDPVLTGRENVELVARLYRIGRAEARRRTGEVLTRFGLDEVADKQVKTYSGGTRRRLDLATSILIRPRVLFLDEPTTGLDLESRLGLWTEIEMLVREGTTVLLTTQYLDEADRLAKTITVLDKGRAVAQGTPSELKSRVGGDRVEFVLEDPARLDDAVALLRAPGAEEPVVDRPLAQITARMGDDLVRVADALNRLADHDIRVATHVVRRPTLDDVFLALTGSRAAAAGAGTSSARKGEGK
ncbi:ATP-binding cassette domain-containing protein [Micromonospora tulbaghiae]|uniref:ATP-binding cassette domain-containing protein n=1 Tax=Micromonospora tulbaghiae TaxID=479978 RepID=UPI003EB980D4